jgi:hypothetical protein
MTIIAYRDGVMATDSQTVSGGRIAGVTRKLCRAPDGTIAAACGDAGVCHRFRKWVESGLVGDFDPKVERGDFGALIARPGGGVDCMDWRGNLVSVKAEFYADGCAADMAIGAMAHGASAIEAVAICIDHDSACGGEIQSDNVG